ncbi:Holliday junction resolvase RecU [Limosilactobacillus caecicola]|uniref:Holliday junction resolvase RecU n=1 Tax=Limosilactobacillus caecicola TaxID=2941332 RepID=UPI002041F5F2|nr:Holliday junction resolvase RecU [Limosilactobacillus caecicola]
MSIHYPTGQGPTNRKIKRANHVTLRQASYSKRGMSLEKEINDSNQYYLATHQAVIHKKPTPIQLVKVDYPKRSAAVIKEAYFRRPSTTDYNGIYRGYYIDFDAKETRNKRSFPLKNFHQHQINHLMACQEQGGICFAFIKFTTLDLLYLLPATKLFDYWQSQKNGGKSSITLATIKKDGIKVEYGLNPRLQYLPAIDQLIAIYKKGEKHE